MSTPEDPQALFRTALQGATSAQERAEIWHAHMQGGGVDRLNDDAAEASRAFHAGTPADVIELASKDIGARAIEAANHMKDPDARYKLDG